MTWLIPSDSNYVAWDQNLKSVTVLAENISILIRAEIFFSCNQNFFKTFYSFLLILGRTKVFISLKINLALQKWFILCLKEILVLGALLWWKKYLMQSVTRFSLSISVMVSGESSSQLGFRSYTTLLSLLYNHLPYKIGRSG